MSFITPIFLWSLLAIPLLVFLFLRMDARRKRLAERYGSLGFVGQVTGRSLDSRRYIPSLLFLIGLIILFISLARPKMTVSLPVMEGTVILAFDISGSMSANDFEPSRMEVAKIVGREFVQRQPATVSIGVVAFSEGGFSVQLPTNDQVAILAAIDRLKTERGTSLANGIVVSLNAIATTHGEDPILNIQQPPPPKNVEDSAVIVLLTDGENNMDPDPLMAAQIAADRGVRIHTIAIGSPEGTLLTVNGFTVFTKLDEPTMQAISEMTEGEYYNAQTEEDLQTIYEGIDPQLMMKAEDTEITAIFAGVSILFLLAGGILSLFWFSRVP